MTDSGNHKDSKASSEEIDSPEQVNDDAGTRRSYGCMFCRRGFSTAQALGGHMNIHRKDRARIRQQLPVAVPSVSHKPDEDSENYGYFHSYQNHRPVNSLVSESLKNYAMYYPGSTMTAAAARVTGPFGEDGVACSQRPRELSLFGGDGLHLGLNLHAGGRRVYNDDEGKRHSEDGELDLELRLGYVS